MLVCLYHRVIESHGQVRLGMVSEFHLFPTEAYYHFTYYLNGSNLQVLLNLMSSWGQ